MNLHQRVAAGVASLLPESGVVNLGIGIPTLVAALAPAGVHLQTENGLLGVGPPPPVELVDLNLVDAGKRPITAVSGAAYFDSVASFAMIRGRHVDVAVLGALQVDARGMLANWALAGRPILGVGGAMDLLTGAKTVIVAMTHTTRDGKSKIVERCELPLTGQRPVDVIVTEKATFRLIEGRLTLTRVDDGVSLDEVRAATDADFVLDRTVAASYL